MINLETNDKSEGWYWVKYVTGEWTISYWDGDWNPVLQHEIVEVRGPLPMPEESKE